MRSSRAALVGLSMILAGCGSAGHIAAPFIKYVIDDVDCIVTNKIIMSRDAMSQAPTMETFTREINPADEMSFIRDDGLRATGERFNKLLAAWRACKLGEKTITRMAKENGE